MQHAHSQTLLDLDTARNNVLDAVASINERHACTLQEALGRIVDQDIVSPIDVPSFANSAMDGYAFCFAQWMQKTTGRCQLDIGGTAWAGKPLQIELRPGQCARIMTGAIVPKGLDTVIMQEKVHLTEQRIEFSLTDVTLGEHIRAVGENMRKGNVVMSAGKRITPADMGVLASLGIETITVKRKLKVAIFSTGDELRQPGEALAEGQIYDANRYCLLGVLQRLNVQCIDLGIIPDDPDSIEKTLLTAAQQADMIITSGGVSVGEADFVKPILDRIGDMHFWKIAMKPGKPFTFGRIHGCIFFALPGNPVSVLANFYELVQAAVLKMMGSQAPQFIEFNAVCLEPLRKTPGRIDFQRGILRKNQQGQWTVRPIGGQESHILSGMSQANCFIVLAAPSGDLIAGSQVKVQPFAALI